MLNIVNIGINKNIIFTNSYKIWAIIALELFLFLIFSFTPNITPDYLTKYSISLLKHLLVNYANLTLIFIIKILIKSIYYIFIYY